MNLDNIEVLIDYLFSVLVIKLLICKVGVVSVDMVVELVKYVGFEGDIIYLINNGLVEIVLFGISKVIGVDEIVWLFGIFDVEVVVFGDMFNDVLMLLWVGLGVVMGNVYFDVLVVVDEVIVFNSEDGVVWVLECWWF